MELMELIIVNIYFFENLMKVQFVISVNFVKFC